MVLRPADLGRWARSAVVGSAVVGSAALAALPGPGLAQSLFEAAPLDMQRFVLVAAPIGSKGDRAQLNIYEQLSPKRACFSVGAGKPAVVDPLLAGFDFTGICSRYIDANGFSLRIGGTDLATSYRLMVSRSSDDTLLLGLPTKAGAGPELVIARTQGPGGGFLKFELEPGWTLMRRAFRGRQLGHVYVYAADWPGAAATAPAPSSPTGPIPAGAGKPASMSPTSLTPATAGPTNSALPTPLGNSARPASALTPPPAVLPKRPAPGAQRRS
ncbi:MAG: DUF3747 domain-containing protein [Synechococcaceae cyanobacterium]|nr:DUF3747 domain-containing protein [Synechococcaceae cyanobacterium]